MKRTRVAFHPPVQFIFSLKSIAIKLLEQGGAHWQTHETNANAMKLYDKVAEKSGFLVYRKIL